MEMTDILRRYQAPFKIQYASAITGAQIQAMNAVLECRTPRYGAMTLECTGCNWHSCQYHACGNRACPGAKTMTHRNGWKSKRENSCRLSISW